METRGKSEAGFGLIELLISMVVLNVAILALVASFNSGIVALARSAHVSTASVLADKQMEHYRALPYACIYLTSASIPASGIYVTSGTAEGFWNAAQVTTPQPAGATCSNVDAIASTAKQLPAASPDHRRYEIDSYIVAAAAAGNGRAELKVSVSVRDVLSGQTWARQSSLFDQATGA